MAVIQSFDTPWGVACPDAYWRFNNWEAQRNRGEDGTYPPFQARFRPYTSHADFLAGLNCVGGAYGPCDVLITLTPTSLETAVVEAYTALKASTGFEDAEDA